MKLLYTLLLSALYLSANDNYSFKAGITEEDILTSKVWNQLLYYKNNKSEINTKSFFLSENGKTNPKEELQKTLDSYSTENINDNSSICKFPDRYYYLSKYVDFKDYKPVNENCTKLNKWEYLSKTKSISLILVSGYISNPASTFGHSFLKLNLPDNNLFSSSINYGALVPENENMFRYIVYGLSGFYEAGFSDQYFYTQDLTYTNTEFRDLWDYELDLTEEQKLQVLFHIWAVVGNKYDYYFLNKNCGFRVTEIINLVSKHDLLDKNNLWFLPVETFNDLEAKEPELIKNIRFIPSNKRIFNAYFDMLTDSQKLVVKNLLSNNFENREMFDPLNETDKIAILDFLMTYYKNAIITDPKNKSLEEAKKKVLIERFKYRVSKQEKVEIEEKESPAKNTDPIEMALFTGFDSTREFTGLSFSPFKQTSLGISNLEYDNLTVLETRIGLDKENVFLDKFDLIKLTKINLDKNNLLNEFPYNWSVHIGIENFNNDIRHFANAGIGTNLYANKSFLINSFATASINDNNYLSAIPSIGIEYKYLKSSFKISQEKEIGLFKKENKDMTNFALQYNFNKEYNLSYELKLIESEYKNLLSMKFSF